MGKKKSVAVKDPYEEAYGPLTVVYISEAAYKRLNGEERYGKWYDVCEFSTSPSKTFCYKTKVPQGSLEGGKFHPDRYEPEIVVEMCEKISDKEIAREVEKNKPRPVFTKKGQIVWIMVRGAGVTSYEQHEILSIKKGKVLLDNGEGNDPTGPFDSTTGKDLRDSAYSLGFSFKLLSEKPKDYKPEDE